MVGDLSSSNNEVQGRKATSSTGRERRRKWLKRRERWIVILGVILHAIYMLSIFDIYFKTPIVHGMDLVTPSFSAPAKRLVLLVADGLRADKFYEPDNEGKYRAPFLRNVIKHRGRWGVSHARPPTESRPGHVSIIAGFYEDPSAVTKGWKANPVEFDSVFNRSQHTISYGSPDIVPIFCGALSHSTWNTYPHEFEDFATDASFLDEWSFDQFQSLVNRSNEDPKLKELLRQDNVVIFLHLLGCDSNGHAHRPFSPIYLNNVKVVDHIAERVYDLLEDYFKDNRTAYIFTADHGMSDKGSHGDGHRSNTDTPLVAWGAGVKHPMPTFGHDHNDYGTFVDDHVHDMPTPKEWGLGNIERVDVNQADIAPLMSALLGLPCPANSVGSLPLGYINLNKAEEVEAVLANAKQILNQFLRKSQLKQESSLSFKPFKPLAHYSLDLEQINSRISDGDYESAMKLAVNLRRVGSGAMIITVGGAARYLDRRVRDNKYWSNLLNCDRKTKFPFLFELQSLLIGLSSVMVLLSTSHRTKNRELLALHQLINWLTAGFSMALPLFSATGLLSRLTSIFLGFAPAFLLLSIGYEAVFYGALALALMAWILFENALLHYSKTSASQTSIRGVEDNFQLENENRSLQLSDMRIPLVFVVLFNVAFFGTGNFASIASFEISSVYRFITIFSPFLMAALLIFKLLIPFLLVICAFSAITKLVRVPRVGCYFLVILCSDVMTIHFFYLVRNKGSWMEIGNSISHFGIVSAQVVFVLLLFALTNIYTKDIQTRSGKQFSRKDI
ncbi:hypothetical protein AgCh_008062 [Apium graveolens]